jgi:c-di-GMP-binding flagellar brake protein YcgR
VSRSPVRRDTRKHARGSLALPVFVSDAVSKARVGIRFDSADVSGGGAFLRSDMLFEVGELLMLQFSLPDGRAISARGRVVRASREVRDGETGKERVSGMGIEFVDLPPEDRAAIDAQLP